ncbi:MAG TPA: M48 family metallopeptidase, partial [Gammaproteobacteria bacterium]|nr:M48 family metallopeptidase [Gammaproteobacteria bacterium]
AFALPGGKIGVYTGMLQVATTQDQLAAVIGHEIAHVVAAHSNERISTQAATQMGLTVANSSGVNRNVQALLGVGAQYGILLPYSRTQESEADVLGLELMARAGFNPEASVQVWKNMAEKYGNQPPEFLLTHPSYNTRMMDLHHDMPQAKVLYEAAKAQGLHPACHL